ncbi:MAG: aldehyde dehydrogenase family protein, partial [Cytophagia bacterium]|nr:aldehyde dehydrogenase family protein [Cytophagia bacterium]
MSNRLTHAVDPTNQVVLPEWWDRLQIAGQRMAQESYQERRDRLERLSKVLRTNEKAICEALHKDLGKPALETKLTELLPVYLEIRHFKKNLRRWMKNRPVRPHFPYLLSKAHLAWQPKGCVLIVAPWNYPMNLALMPLIAALAAGNSVVIKPSEFASATAELLTQLLSQAIGNEAVRVVTGDASVGAALCALPFDHMLFTGSERVGRKVAMAAADQLIPCTLELGGKSPVYVDESAPLASAASKIYWGKWLNGGQTCIAPDYVLVNRSMIPALVEELKAAAMRAKGKDDSTPPSLCCQIHQEHANRMRQLLLEAVQQGAR